MRRFPRAFAVLLLAVLLSGCAMPVSVQIASFVADTISWFSTDKTLADHAISLATNEDCSVLRGLSGNAICRDNEGSIKDGGTVIASVEAGNGETTVIPTTTPAVAITYPEEPAQMMPIAVTPAEPATATGNSKLHFVLASFKVADNAKRLVDGNPLLSPTIVNVNVDNRTMHRVVVGPFMKEERKALARRIAKAGFTDAWIIRMDANREPRKNHPPGSQLASAFR